MKNYSGLILIIVFLVSLSCFSFNISDLTDTSATEATPTTNSATVNANNGLNLRSGPGFEHSIITVLLNNTTISVISEQNGWCQVNANGTNGWVKKEFLSGLETSQQTNSTATTANLPAGNTARYVIARSGLNLRMGPGTGYAVVSVIDFATQVELLDTRPGYAQVRVNGREGWVDAMYLGTARPASNISVSRGTTGSSTTVSSGTTTSGNSRTSANTDPRFSFSNLTNMARRAQSGVSRDCYRTTVRTAQLNGASGDGRTWPSSTRYRGMTLGTGLSGAIADGNLKPGMVVYINNRPGADPNSMVMRYQPHWFTYLGKDHAGIDRFSDQYGSDWSLNEFVSYYNRDAYGETRKMDEILDPYRR